MKWTFALFINKIKEMALLKFVNKGSTCEMTKTDYLEGQILIAMPTMSDPRFARSVIYICAHSQEGAMGLVINKPAENIDFAELMSRLNIPDGADAIEFDMNDLDRVVHFGGPVEPGRGFVLHTGEYNCRENTLAITDDVGLTATLDVLHEIAAGEGPKRSLLALGYAGWSPGQLESEIMQNGWLHCAADENLLFCTGAKDKYQTALDKLGIDPVLLSSDAGRA